MFDKAKRFLWGQDEGEGAVNQRRKDQKPEDQRREDLNDVVFREEIIAHVKKQFEERRQARTPFELQWQLNMNFLQGNQFCDINMAAQRIQEIPKMYYWQEREVFNHIAPIIETRLAKLARVRPMMKALPSSREMGDISTAKVTTSILRGCYRRLNMSKRIKSATVWSEIVGTAIYKQIWNPKEGRMLGYLDDAAVFEGEIQEVICPPYEIYPDSPWAEDVEQCRCIMHARAYHVDDIEEIWGIRVEGREVDVFRFNQTNIGLGGLGYTASIPKITTTKKKDHAIVYEESERPSKRYPQGRLIIVVEDKLVHYGPLPYRVGENNKPDLPFSRQVSIERPGCFWGVSVIERCIPIQRSYNSVKNRKHEYLNRTAIGVMNYEEGSIDEEDLQENGLAPGAMIPYQKGFSPPQFMKNAALPGNFESEENKLVNEFILVSGVSELSRNSEAPTGVGSGVALEILREQDETRLSLTAEHIRQSMILVGKQWIRLYRQYATGPRMLRFVGNNNDVMVAEFQGSDLTTDDIVIETENELTQTPAQKKQTVYDLLQAGLLVDPDTGQISRRMRGKIFEMLELGNWETADEMDDLHVTRAQRENMLLEKGEIPEIREYDEDELHLLEHNRYRLSSEYEELMRERPDIAEALDDHAKLHEASAQFKQQRILNQQMIMKAQQPSA